MALLSIIAATGKAKGPGGGFTEPMPEPLPDNWPMAAILDDDGYYNGFPMLSDSNGNAVYGVYKKASSHAAGGPLMLIKTADGFNTWTKTNIKVDGVQIASTNHSFCRLSTGRLLISYRVDGTMYFAYSDTDNHEFLSTGTPIIPPSGYLIAQSPIKMVETSYGTILFAYYVVGPENAAVLMESTDNGISYNFKCEVYRHSGTVGTDPVGTWKGNEIAICETHPTGVQSTSKWIAIVRTAVANDGGTYSMFFNSSDGANTWVKDMVTVAGSFVDDNGNTVSGNFSKHLFYRFLASNSPVDIRLYNGLVYVVNGERNLANGYALKYTTATPNGAFDNSYNAWSAPVRVMNYNPGGSSYDQGYPIIFLAEGHLYVGQYQVSAQPPITQIAARRAQVEILKVIDATS